MQPSLHEASLLIVVRFLSVPYVANVASRHSSRILPSSRQHLSYDCSEDKTEDCQNCSVLCCVRQLCTLTHTYQQALPKVDCWFMFRFPLDLLRFAVFYHFIPILFAFVVLGLVSSVLRYRDWLGRTSTKWHILCRVGRETLTQSINQFQKIMANESMIHCKLRLCASWMRRIRIY